MQFKVQLPLAVRPLADSECTNRIHTLLLLIPATFNVGEYSGRYMSDMVSTVSVTLTMRGARMVYPLSTAATMACTRGARCSEVLSAVFNKYDGLDVALKAVENTV